ncbi:MAG: hypothetical protein QOG83_2190 [Alphaproteobacteria bacterium]|nr:hypothetical protein [Alphaproteobacteria bacterium]
MRLRTVLIGTLLAAGSFAGATVAMQVLWPAAPALRSPPLAEMPPLPATSGASVIVAPATITLAAIRDFVERDAPRNFAGKRDIPVSQLLSNAEVAWTAARGPVAVAGRPDALVVSSVINGTARATGQLSAQATSGVSTALGNLLGKDVGRSVERFANRTLDQRADIRGSATVTLRPEITPAWRIEPNLVAQAAVADANLSVAGLKLNVANEVKPHLDRTVNEHAGAIAARLRNDPFLENAARREWAKLCRSMPLGAAGAGLPNLWVEVRPVRAFATQPRVDAAAVTVTLGVEAETRVVAAATKPDCAFPANLEIVAREERPRIAIAVPIDVPFTEINRLIEARLVGKTLAADNSGAVEVTVRSAQVAASGNRLLMSLKVTANEKKSWFGLATEATVHVWGRPVLDPERQMLRLADVALDVESDTAFGLLGAAARAARPYLATMVAENALVDLKPFAANARKGVETAIADFRTSADGVRVDAAITELRLTGLVFDAKTLRVIAEAEGSARISVTALPARQ